MLLKDLFHKYFFSKKADSVIRRISRMSFGALIVALAAFVLVMSVMKSMNTELFHRLLAVEPTVTVLMPDIQQLALAKNHPAVQKLKMDEEQTVFVVEKQDVIVKTIDGYFQGGVAKGITQEHFDFLLERINSPQSHIALTTRDLVLGVDLADSIRAIVGDPLTLITPDTLIMPPTEVPRVDMMRLGMYLSSNVGDFDNQAIFYLQGAKLTENSTRSFQVEVYTKKDPQLIVQELAAYPDLKVETWMERNKLLLFSLKLERFLIGLFLAMAGLIATFSTYSLLALLMSQKKKEMAILFALGMHQNAIRSLFFRMGLALAGLGILLGAGLGSFVSYMLELYPIPMALPGFYYNRDFSAQLDMQFVSIMCVCFLAIVALGFWHITKSVYELKPAETLKKNY